MGSERILGTSRLPKEAWMAYAECFVLMLPLRECARRCRVCLKTAYTIRYRLIECLSAYSPSFRSSVAAAASSTRPTYPSRSRATARRGRSRCRARRIETVVMVALRYTRKGTAMPSNIPTTTIRIDLEVKREATAILDELGLSMSTAVKALLRALVRECGMPFEMRVKTPAPDGKAAR